MALEICEETFPGVKNPKQEVERGFRFWDVVSPRFHCYCCCCVSLALALFSESSIRLKFRCTTYLLLSQQQFLAFFALFLTLRVISFFWPLPLPEFGDTSNSEMLDCWSSPSPLLALCSKKEWGVGDCERADRSQGTKKPIQSFTS